jgi:hypothetical protein
MPTNKLEILPVKSMENRSIKSIPSPLLQPPFLWIIVGSVRSGKSVMLMNLLMNKNFGYNAYFDNIIFISPTLPSDKTGQILYKDEEIVKITDGLENLNEILQVIVEEQRDSDETLLVVLDDVLGLLGSNQSFFSSLCSRYRHYNMSIVITTQDFKRIPQTARYNCSTYCLFKSHNQKEIEKLDDELGGMFPKFLDLYKEATSEKFSFLYLDMEKARAFKRFDTLLWEK